MKDIHRATISDAPREEGRRLLLASIAASAIASLVPVDADAAQSADGAGGTNPQVVTEFCAAVSKRQAEAIRPFLADDVVYRMTETMPPIAGLEAVVATYTKVFSDATSVEFQVLETFTAGPIVINRRVDRFVSPRGFTWEGVGVFFIKDGKIKEWSDYTIRLVRA